MLLLFCYFVKVKTFGGEDDKAGKGQNVILNYYII